MFLDYILILLLENNISKEYKHPEIKLIMTSQRNEVCQCRNNKYTLDLR